MNTSLICQPITLKKYKMFHQKFKLLHQVKHILLLKIIDKN